MHNHVIINDPIKRKLTLNQETDLVEEILKIYIENEDSEVRDLLR